MDMDWVTHSSHAVRHNRSVNSCSWNQSWNLAALLCYGRSEDQDLQLDGCVINEKSGPIVWDMFDVSCANFRGTSALWGSDSCCDDEPR